MLNSIHCPQLQIEMLQKRPHVLGATPGRLLDLVDDGMLTLGLVRGGAKNAQGCLPAVNVRGDTNNSGLFACRSLCRTLEFQALTVLLKAYLNQCFSSISSPAGQLCGAR